jgi:type II secretory pathway pseudopilin PulG
VLLVVGFVGVLAAIALPNFIQIKDKAKEAEVKQNLHTIQLAVERFEVDRDRDYPQYLIGGSTRYSASINPEASAFSGTKDSPDKSKVSDILLREGYLDEYPANPFTRNGVAIHQLQENLPTALAGADMLRNGTSTGQFGTRFGPTCELMGNVLADPRYTKWNMKTGKAGVGNQPTYADMEYQFWDMWAGKKPLPYLPGQFFYKSAGKLTQKEAAKSSNQPVIPGWTMKYILGGYGSVRTKGKDVLGDELPIQVEGKELWVWTRSSLGGKGGSPFSPASDDSMNQLSYENPNGVRDALIILLTNGEGHVVP